MGEGQQQEAVQEPVSGGRRRRRWRRRWQPLLVASVAAVAVAGFVALDRDADTADVAGEERTTSSGGAGDVDGDDEATAPLPTAPKVSLARTTDLVDGEVVALHATGLVPGSTLGWEVCDEALRRCGASDGNVDAADRDGELRAEARLWRMFGVHGAEPGAGGTLDCALDACRIRFWGESSDGGSFPVLDVSFDPTHGERPPPTARLLDEGPYRAGEVVRIRLAGVAPGVVVDALLCNPNGGECVGAGATGGSGDPVIELVLPEVPSQWRQGCERCPITFGGYYVEDPAGRPPLLDPDTLWITIAG